MIWMQRISLLPRRWAVFTVMATLAAAFTASEAPASSMQRAQAENILPVQLRTAPGPQPGSCRSQYVTVMAQNPQQAVAIWQASVSQSLGASWAIWVGAQNQQILPQGANQFMATAQPCFHHPVQ